MVKIVHGKQPLDENVDQPKLPHKKLLVSRVDVDSSFDIVMAIPQPRQA